MVNEQAQHALGFNIVFLGAITVSEHKERNIKVRHIWVDLDEIQQPANGSMISASFVVETCDGEFMLGEMKQGMGTIIKIEDSAPMLAALG